MAISSIMSRSLISAGNTMKMAEIRQGLNKEMEHRAGVLNAEIKLDGGRGADTRKKEEELEKTEEKASKINVEAMNSLSEMNNELRSAANRDQEEARAEKKQAEKLSEKRKTDKEEQAKRLEKLQEKNVGETTNKESDEIAEGTTFVNFVADGITPASGVVEDVGGKVDIKT